MNSMPEKERKIKCKKSFFFVNQNCKMLKVVSESAVKYEQFKFLIVCMFIQITVLPRKASCQPHITFASTVSFFIALK